MKKKIWIAAGCVAFAALIVGAVLLYDTLSENYAPQNQQQQQNELTDAPDFTAVDADGNTVKLSEFEGKPVVVNFWASWCPPCKSEMPHFEDAYKKYGNEIQIMMVDLTDGSSETVSSGKAYIESMGYTFPVFFDTEGEASIAYATTSIPATYFINADGKLVARAVGMISADNLEQGIQMIKQET